MEIYKPKIVNIGKAIKKHNPKILLEEYFKDISEITIARIPNENIIYLNKENFLFSFEVKKIKQANKDNRGKYIGL